MKSYPRVSVCMITYGHEAFIAQAINGVFIQETNFDIELIIANDCSPDATDTVVQKILDTHPKAHIIKYTKHPKNIGMMPNFVYALSQCQGDYIAICEGDDYWTDPQKLQKQVDFLETNHDYSICWTKYLEKNESNDNAILHEPEWVHQVERDKDLSFDLTTIFNPYCTLTLTAMFRKTGFDFEILKRLKFAKDNTLYALCLTYGDGMLLNFTSAVYRMHEGGIYSKVSLFKKALSNYLNFKEIIDNIPSCKNSNFITKRNFYLHKAIQLVPSKREEIFWNLLYDGYCFLGWKSIILIIRNKLFKKNV